MDTSWLVAGINQLIEGTSPAKSTKEDAHKEIDAFSKRTTTSPWNIAPSASTARSAVAFRLESLVDDPRRVRQGALGTCGPAAFLRSWIPEDPLGFVKFATELYETGKSKLGTMDIKPSSDLVGQDYAKNVDAAIKKKYPGFPQMLCPPAEWIVMCSLIDVANVSSYTGTPEEDWTEGSTSGDMIDWFEAVGHTVDSWRNWGGNHEFIYQLSPVAATRHIVLVINSYLLTHTTRGALSWLRKTLDVPTHFVVLDTPVTNGFDGKINFDAWTWGQTPTTTYFVTQEEIDDYVDEVIRAQH